MNRLARALQRASEILAELERDWALVGGLAVSVRTEPRFTRDVDLAIAVNDDRDAEALVRTLQSRSYEVLATVEQEATGRLATVRLGERGSPGGVVVDALFASSGIEPELAAAADELEVFPTVTVPVATTGHLIALKVLSRDEHSRPLDQADLVALLKTASPSDLEQARAALDLISDRGFHRGRSLRRDLETLLSARG